MQRTARRFRIVATAIAVLVIATFGLVAWQLWATEQSERASLRQHAEQRAGQIAASAAGRVGAIVRSADFVLLAARSLYGENDPAFHDLVDWIRTTFPEAPGLLLHFSVAAANGELVYSSLGRPRDVHVAEPDAFKFHRDGGDRLHISDLVLSHLVGAETIQFTRAVLRDGHFAGVVAISLSPQQLGALLGSNTESVAELVLLGREDAVLALSDDARRAALLGRKLPDTVSLATGAAPARGALRRGVFGDGAEHVVARQGVPGTDLAVVAALDWNATLEPLTQRFRRAWKNVVALGAALLLLGAGVIALLLRVSRQQQAIAASEVRFRSLTQLSSDWYWEQDDRFRFTLVAGNDVARTGISADAHLGRMRWDIPALNLSASDWARHRALLEAHQPFRDFEIRRPDTASGPHWVSVSGEPMFDERGRFTGYRGIGRDITERRLADKALRESEATLAGVIDTAMDAIITIDERQQILSFNPAAERIFGYHAAEMLERPIGDLLPERLRELHHRHVERFGESGETRRDMGLPGEIVGLRSDGTEIRLEATIARVQAGGRLQFSVMMRDVTERRRIEQRVREQARLLDLIFRHSIDSIVLLDRDFNFLRVSASYAKACQRDVAEFEGRNHFDLYPSSFREEAERARDAKAIYLRRERPFVFPDHPEWGTTYWDIALVPILGADGEVELLLLTLRDVSEQVRANTALRGSAARLRRLSGRLREVEERERRAMARELHDRIGQNLSTLNLGLGMLGQQIAAGQVHDAHEQLAEMQQTLRAVIGHARDLMSELRPPALEEYGLLAALQDLAADFGRKTRIAARVEGSPLEPRPPGTIEIAMYRIAQEALSNSAKHAGATRVRLSLASSGDAIELAISDDGIGFDASQPRAADPTWGLTTMRERAEEAGIDLGIDSAPGRGTRITLRAARPT